jgi:hypothetical protein
MLKVLVVGGLLLVIGSRVIGVRVIGARSPRYRDSVVILTAIAQHSLLAFVFAWVELRVAADDPLRLAIAVSLFIISAFQALLAAVDVYVLATGRWRDLADN